MKIQLKRSNQIDGGFAKEPTATQMEFGELAVNYATSDPAIFLKKQDNTIVRIAGAGGEGSFSGDYNDLINAPTIGDGSITINNADGSENATFTVNQTGPTTVTLPAGFSGDYDDLINTPDIPDSAADINASLQAVTDVGNNTTNSITIDTDKILLNADGSAAFAGAVTATEFNPGATGAGNFRIDLLPNITTAPK